MSGGHLLDLNVLLALLEPAHEHHGLAQDWFNHTRKERWGICPLTEAGFIRVTTNPSYSAGPRSTELAIAVLRMAQKHPECSFWEIRRGWIESTAPFAKRIFGHHQTTDAYLLGLAIAAHGELVTFDKAIRHLAGREFSQHLCVIE